MVGGSHSAPTTDTTLSWFRNAYAMTPPMPVLCGETGYEGHMQQHFEDTQRYVFWMYMLSGAAGHTYGAAGVWHVSVAGDPGIKPVYDWTTWTEGMNVPGSTQLGLCKGLLEEYPWHQFTPHPEWASTGFAAGITSGVRFIYIPNHGIYNWSGITVNSLLSGVPYSAFYFDPASGIAANTTGVTYKLDFDYGTAVYAGSSQATAAIDGLLVQVLRADNTVLASNTYSPGAWSNPSNANLSAGRHGTLQYVGDGSGVVRLRIGPTPPYTSGRFEGEIDNIILKALP